MKHGTFKICDHDHTARRQWNQGLNNFIKKKFYPTNVAL